MWQVSEEWTRAIPTSSTITIRAEVWRGGASTGDSIAVTGGQVHVDETSSTRRQLTLTSSDVDLMPSALGDLLSPVDCDLHVYYGQTYTEGYVEEVPVGVFRVTAPSRQGLLTDLSLAADDYSGVLTRARFLSPWATPAGSLVADEIARMVNDVLPWVPVLNLTGSTTRTKVATWDRDRWAACKSLASAIGCEVLFDPAGTCIVRPVQTVGTRTASEADWSVAAGDALIDLGSSMSIDGVYNAVVATSSDPNYPNVSATAYVRSGPLAWRDGVKFPRFYASPQLTTVQQCQSAAQAMLTRSSAFATTLVPVVMPNAALDAGDLLAITVPRNTTQRGRWIIPDPSLPDPDPTLRTVSGFTLPLQLSDTGMPVTGRTDADLAIGSLT